MKILIFLFALILVKGKEISSQANCSQEISWIVQNLTDLNITYYLSSPNFLNSGHFLNNLGGYDECQDDPQSKYSLLQISIKGVSTFFTGVCAVKECSATELRMVENK